MKYLNFLPKTPTLIFLTICIIIASVLHVTNIHFPCLNSDEASFAYNAFSILKTGKDEYGIAIPTRFKAFGENKLPVTIYSIVPSIAIFGLSDISSRLPFILLGIFSPILFFALAKELLKSSKYAPYIAAFLASLSPWIQILSRHIHEAIIIMYLGALTLILLARLMRKYEFRYIGYIALLQGISLFTYHIAKVMFVFYAVWLLAICVKQKNPRLLLMKTAAIMAIPILIFIFTEWQTPTNRVSNLLFYKNQGFSLTIDELRRENPNRLIHNKLNYAAHVVVKQYVSYFSPEFLVTKGDANKRFGFPGISPISIVEYLFLFMGLYFLFKNKHDSRYLILTTLLFAPISAALTWIESSLTRSFFMIVPILLSVSYGIEQTILQWKSHGIKILFGGIIFVIYGYFTFFSWEYYFYHYPKKTEALYGWQCGYKELTDYIKTTYADSDTFFITKKLGQPYIFTLFYLAYPPDTYQSQAKLGEIGEYGFGEVEKYDKFEFNFRTPDPQKNAVYIGYPDDFQGSKIPQDQIKKITIGIDDIFYIYDSPYKKR